MTNPKDQSQKFSIPKGRYKIRWARITNGITEEYERDATPEEAAELDKLSSQETDEQLRDRLAEESFDKEYKKFKKKDQRPFNYDESFAHGWNAARANQDLKIQEFEAKLKDAEIEVSGLRSKLADCVATLEFYATLTVGFKRGSKDIFEYDKESKPQALGATARETLARVRPKS